MSILVQRMYYTKTLEITKLHSERQLKTPHQAPAQSSFLVSTCKFTSGKLSLLFSLEHGVEGC